jgi:aminoglycoside phosphotransferase (APT) family kinase protein
MRTDVLLHFDPGVPLEGNATPGRRKSRTPDERQRARMSKPAAEIDLPLEFVRELLVSQHPDLATEPIAEITAGWDNAMFRLGSHMAIRLPRRSAAAALIKHEQRWLPLLQHVLPLPVPTPIRIGQPRGAYPWSWSIIPWIDGETVEPGRLSGDQAPVLAGFLEALHVTPPSLAPRNPYRGVPLAQRSPTFARCVRALTQRGRSLDARLLRLWDAAIESPIDTAPTWIHGDLHARNVLAANGRISGVIDWGDMAAGDRATDLAATWMLFSQPDGREQVLQSCKSVSALTWRRARGWALLLAVVILESADPLHVTMAELTMQRLLDGP